jgi:hypothetical protein
MAEEFAGHDLASDLVLGEALEREVPQSGVLGAPDSVFAAGASAVPGDRHRTPPLSRDYH